MMDTSKAIQENDILAMLITRNSDRFADIIYTYFSESLEIK